MYSYGQCVVDHFSDVSRHCYCCHLRGLTKYLSVPLTSLHQSHTYLATRRRIDT